MNCMTDTTMTISEEKNELIRDNKLYKFGDMANNVLLLPICFVPLWQQTKANEDMEKNLNFEEQKVCKEKRMISAREATGLIWNKARSESLRRWREKFMSEDMKKSAATSQMQ